VEERLELPCAPQFTFGLFIRLPMAERSACAPACDRERDLPRYFLHLVDSVDILLDPDGTELAEDAVEGAAMRAARDCMAGDVQSGKLDLTYRIEVHDESGRLVHSLPFVDAVKIVRTH
jgi:hypothetical protein